MSTESRVTASLFNTRPSVSGSAPVTNADMVDQELSALRHTRRQAYRRNQGPCCLRASGRESKPAGIFSRLAMACCWVVAMVVSPLLLVASLLGRFVWFLWSSFFVCLSFVLGSLFRLHFWVGIVTAGGLLALVAKSHCTDAPHPTAINVVCTSDHPWAFELREAARRASSLSIEGRVVAMRATDIGSDAIGIVLGTVFPGKYCRFRGTADDVAVACAQKSELRVVLRAPDCAALRRAHHEGQRHFHPDRLRLKHPACSSEVLEACSVALNLAVENRRKELGCQPR
eukprot:TRINITY_DN58680_c0_g1_i1.p1 TRINITY_DN58680_c0_g1~~TRINITY_DN58680_c0_g1_i1.p1  ORF type:complete len:316 (-),score=29.79 TRINITY_DN58680_c0_g1_i1:98-955(-)